MTLGSLWNRGPEQAEQTFQMCSCSKMKPKRSYEDILLIYNKIVGFWEWVLFHCETMRLNAHSFVSCRRRCSLGHDAIVQGGKDGGSWKEGRGDRCQVVMGNRGAAGRDVVAAYGPAAQ